MAGSNFKKSGRGRFSARVLPPYHLSVGRPGETLGSAVVKVGSKSIKTGSAGSHSHWGFTEPIATRACDALLSVEGALVFETPRGRYAVVDDDYYPSAVNARNVFCRIVAAREEGGRVVPDVVGADRIRCLPVACPPPSGESAEEILAKNLTWSHMPVDERVARSLSETGVAVMAREGADWGGLVCAQGCKPKGRLRAVSLLRFGPEGGPGAKWPEGATQVPVANLYRKHAQWLRQLTTGETKAVALDWEDPAIGR